MRANIRCSTSLQSLGRGARSQGTALVGDPQIVAERLREYMEIGVDRFVLSGNPYLEEAVRFAGLVFPLIPGKRAITESSRTYTGSPFDVRGLGAQGGSPGHLIE
ncbi:hypothetical protein QF002_002050 [Paraburkholderia youngii]